MRLLFLALLASGCTGRTEIVVGVATDLRARGQINLARFVASRNGTPIIDQPWDLSDKPAGHYELPGSFGIYSPDGSEVAVELAMQGYLDTQLVSERKSLVHLVSGQTLFMRLGLVSGCSQINGPSCATNETCIEGVCRSVNEDAHRFPTYRPELVGATNCNSGTQFVVSSSGELMPSLGDQCGANQYCQEGLCYKILPGDDASSGQALWTQQNTPVTRVLHAVWGTSDGQDVFAAGEGGTILHLHGGAPMAASAWIEETLDHSYTLNGLWGTAANDVYAVGTGGTILHRGAAGWVNESGPAVEKLDSVFGVGGEVWAVGRDQGQAVALKRGMSGWARVSGVSGGPLRGIWATSPSQIWSVGFGFNVQRYDGVSWSALTLPGESRDLYGVYGSDDAWMVGADGLVVHGEGALTVEDAGISSDLFAVWAGGPDDLYVAGDFGVILHRTGGTWTRQPSGTQQPLFALWGSGSGDVYAAGRDGTVLHSTGAVVTTPDDLSVPGLDDMGTMPPPDLSHADLTPVAYVNLGHINNDGGFFEDFTPHALTISAGTTVIWSWPANDLGLQNIHSVASCQADMGSAYGCPGQQADGRWCSHAVNPDFTNCNAIIPSPGPFTYSHKFDQAGLYDYFCKQHGSTYSYDVGIGEIIVK